MKARGRPSRSIESLVVVRRRKRYDATDEIEEESLSRARGRSTRSSLKNAAYRT